MDKKVYRVGIVGLTGIVAKEVQETESPFREEIVHGHAAGLSVIDGFDIVAICDLVPELLDKFSKNWGQRWPNAKPYYDFTEMLANSELDILAIATGDHTHAILGEQAAKSGLKGIFCEKPLATSVDDADRLIKACETNNVVITVDHSRRWSPRWRSVYHEVDSGSIGELTTMVGTLGGPRAMLFRNGTHMIDTMCMYAKSNPSQVWARLEEGFEHWDKYKGDGGKLPGNDPGAMGFIQFENGIRAMYCGMKDTQKMFSLQLSGTEGQIFVTEEKASLLTTKEHNNYFQSSTTSIKPKSYTSEGIAAGYQELVNLIENGGEGVSMAREARKTVQILTGFLKSQQNDSSLIDV